MRGKGSEVPSGMAEYCLSAFGCPVFIIVFDNDDDDDDASIFAGTRLQIL